MSRHVRSYALPKIFGLGVLFESIEFGELKQRHFMVGVDGLLLVVQELVKPLRRLVKAFLGETLRLVETECLIRRRFNAFRILLLLLSMVLG